MNLLADIMAASSRNSADWSSGTPDAAIEPMDDVTPHGRSSSGLASRDEGVTIESLANHDGTLPEAAQHLATFRDTMLPSFSFTDLPATVTVEQLQHDRPFFLCAVLAVATPFKSQKVARGRRFKETLIQAALIENQSSLDLLQGLLVFIAWGYDHMHTPCSTPSRLMMVAISLACDLRFDKPLPSDEHMMKPMVDDAFEQQHGRSNNWFVAEEQRAVLACYALSSM